MSFPETLSDSSVRKFPGFEEQLLHQLDKWLISDFHAGKKARCGGPSLAWLHMVCQCDAG